MSFIKPFTVALSALAIRTVGSSLPPAFLPKLPYTKFRTPPYHPKPSRPLSFPPSRDCTINSNDYNEFDDHLRAVMLKANPSVDETLIKETVFALSLSNQNVFKYCLVSGCAGSHKLPSQANHLLFGSVLSQTTKFKVQEYLKNQEQYKKTTQLQMNQAAENILNTNIKALLKILNEIENENFRVSFIFKCVISSNSQFKDTLFTEIINRLSLSEHLLANIEKALICVERIKNIKPTFFFNYQFQYDPKKLSKLRSDLETCKKAFLNPSTEDEFKQVLKNIYYNLQLLNSRDFNFLLILANNSECPISYEQLQTISQLSLDKQLNILLTCNKNGLDISPYDLKYYSGKISLFQLNNVEAGIELLKILYMFDHLKNI